MGNGVILAKKLTTEIAMETSTTENAKDLMKINIVFRDTDHFYKVVKWLNTHVGHGKENWTIDGRVLRLLKRKHAIGPVSRAVVIRNASFKADDALYLTLL